MKVVFIHTENEVWVKRKMYKGRKTKKYGKCKKDWVKGENRKKEVWQEGKIKTSGIESVIMRMVGY